MRSNSHPVGRVAPYALTTVSKMVPRPSTVGKTIETFTLTTAAVREFIGGARVQGGAQLRSCPRASRASAANAPRSRARSRLCASAATSTGSCFQLVASMSASRIASERGRYIVPYVTTGYGVASSFGIARPVRVISLIAVQSPVITGVPQACAIPRWGRRTPHPSTATRARRRRCRSSHMFGSVRARRQVVRIRRKDVPLDPIVLRELREIHLAMLMRM